MQNFPLVSKDVQVRWIGHAKFPLMVSKDVQVRWIGYAKSPLSGISRVNTWGYRDRAWVRHRRRVSTDSMG